MQVHTKAHTDQMRTFMKMCSGGTPVGENMQWYNSSWNNEIMIWIFKRCFNWCCQLSYWQVKEIGSYSSSKQLMSNLSILELLIKTGDHTSGTGMKNWYDKSTIKSSMFMINIDKRHPWHAKTLENWISNQMSNKTTHMTKTENGTPVQHDSYIRGFQKHKRKLQITITSMDYTWPPLPFVHKIK
jgi:hypothetical protein